MTTQEQNLGTTASATGTQGQANQTATVQGIKVGDNIGGAIVHHLDQNGRPFVDPKWMEQFPVGRNGARIMPSQTRQPSMKTVPIIDVRLYNNGRGSRVAFNRGAIHISAAQLSSAGVINPYTLVGKSILVDFFRRGDVLLNGSIVTNDGVIVNQFAVEVDAEVASKIEYELQKEKLSGWLGQAALAYGANNRGNGMGTQNSADSGITPFTQIPAMQQPQSQNPAAVQNSLVDNRFQSAAPVTEEGTQGGSSAAEGSATQANS